MINVDDRIITDGTLKKIGVGAFALYLVICKHMNKKDMAWPGIKRLQDLTGMGRDAIYNGIKKLEEADLLHRDQPTGKGGRFKRVIYYNTGNYVKTYIETTLNPLIEKTPLPEKPYTEKPVYGKPGAEVLNNKEVLNNRKYKVQKQAYCTSFISFWDKYPNKKNKKYAYAIYKRMSKKKRKAAEERLPAYKAYLKANPWQAPLHPSTYLKYDRWEDDFTTTLPEEKNKLIYSKPQKNVIT